MTSNQKFIFQATTYCSRQETCIANVREKLKKLECPTSEIDSVIEHLVAEKYIDEQRYATAYVRDKYRFNKWGRIKIKQMLKTKNISDTNIKLAFEAIDSEAYTNILETELIKKKKTIKGSNPFDIKQKLIRFAISRGYEYDIVDDLINKMA